MYCFTQFSPQKSNFDDLLEDSGGSQHGATHGETSSVSYRDLKVSTDSIGDIDLDEHERNKMLGAIKAKVAGHYGRTDMR